MTIWEGDMQVLMEMRTTFKPVTEHSILLAKVRTTKAAGDVLRCDIWVGIEGCQDELQRVLCGRTKPVVYSLRVTEV